MDPNARGVPIGCRSPLRRGPYSTPIHSRVIADDVDVAMVRVLVLDVVWVILARQEFEIVLNEVTLMNKILLNNLLKYVFFCRQILFQPLDCIQSSPGARFREYRAFELSTRFPAISPRSSKPFNQSMTS